MPANAPVELAQDALKSIESGLRHAGLLPREAPPQNPQTQYPIVAVLSSANIYLPYASIVLLSGTIPLQHIFWDPYLFSLLCFRRIRNAQTHAYYTQVLEEQECHHEIPAGVVEQARRQWAVSRGQ